ncbi:elongator complex protein 6 [Heteronotia binoei]|uniref:elongator complex protein 6 n=1 Tax=Heteronotia binoei TaxID=13085 RepID=UPI00292DC34A|nr:elongator complex protein 6 [Heteronotia binoei]
MFAELSELLGDSAERPQQGLLTLLVASKTDASFLVHHFLSFYLKAGCKVCFLALLQSFSHYNIVAQKLGLGLTTAKERGQLVFLEGLKASNEVLFSKQRELAEPHPFQFISGDGSNLKALYDFVQTALTPDLGRDSWKCPVLIVDDLSVLLSLGVKPTDVLDFVHYCRVTVNSLLKGNMVLTVRSSNDSEDEENELLAKALHHQSNLILRAEGLATGFCRDVHMAVDNCPSQPRGGKSGAGTPASLPVQNPGQERHLFCQGDVCSCAVKGRGGKVRTLAKEPGGDGEQGVAEETG